MYGYLLDTNTVVVFQKARRLDALVASASKVQMAMVDDVYDELTRPRRGKPKTAEMTEAATALRGSAIMLEEIVVGSPEDATRTSLLNRTRGRPGAGEAGCVAFAVSRHDRVIVTTDRDAVGSPARLYAELPGEVGRMIGLHAFLRTLVERGALEPEVATHVSDTAQAERNSNLAPPLWWASWSAAAGAK
jgi:predicted nucleic acid-binding protein